MLALGHRGARRASLPPLKGPCPCPGLSASRRENQLKLSHDWLCYLAPEIVREMTPGKDEDQLPFSKAADIYAFG